MKIIKNDPSGLNRPWFGDKIEYDEPRSTEIWWPGLIIFVIIVAILLAG